MNKEKLSNWTIWILFLGSPFIMAGLVMIWYGIFPNDSKPYENCRDYSRRFPTEVREQAYQECIYDRNFTNRDPNF